MRLRLFGAFSSIAKVGDHEAEKAALQARERKDAKPVVLYRLAVRPRRAEHKTRWLAVDGISEGAPLRSAADVAGLAAGSQPNAQRIDVALVHAGEPKW